MSSSLASFTTSSPVSPLSGRRRKSRFTFKHLSQLAASSTNCPLRVIAHIDLDAFYAQCEGVRLGISDDQPLAVQQWQGLIAINYAARTYGLNRHVNIAEAKKACPNIILQHVATWREGDEHWAYHEDAFKHIATHKVSLDPYRLESRRILAVIKDFLPAPPLQRVEKASIDEVFLDLSAQVHSLLLERYPELNAPPPYDDPTENLPAPPTSALDWNADALVDLDSSQSEEQDPDWDDIAMLVGSEIVRNVRATIRERLKYTCSAGVAQNKMIAKLGSGHKKPNQQTIVRNRAVQHFLSDFKFTKIRMLGGKLGDEIVSMFNTDTVKDLLQVPMEQLKKLGDDTGSWLYQTIRGQDHSEVNPRTEIKSMLSAKSFRPSINTFEQGAKWLRIFVADIYARLVEEGVTENKRRPKTINLHHRQGGQTRSKQSPIPQGKMIDEQVLFDLAKNLLAQVIVDGRAWPCSNLSLSVGGFEDGVTGNKGIGGFLVRGDEAKALQQQHGTVNRPDETLFPDAESVRPEKKRRLDDDRRINQFFTAREDGPAPVDFEEVPSAQQHQKAQIDRLDAEGASATDTSKDMEAAAHTSIHHGDSFTSTLPSSAPAALDSNDATGAQDRDKGHDHHDSRHTPQKPSPSHHRPDQQQQKIETYFCPRCRKTLLADQQDEHADYHFAQDLQAGEDQEQQPSKPPNALAHPTTGPKGRDKTHRAAKGTRSTVEKGQRRLAFGGPSSS